MATPGAGSLRRQAAPSVTRQDSNYLKKKENFTLMISAPLRIANRLPGVTLPTAGWRR
jgi:hypothetical protein